MPDTAANVRTPDSIPYNAADRLYIELLTNLAEQAEQRQREEVRRASQVLEWAQAWAEYRAISGIID